MEVVLEYKFTINAVPCISYYLMEQNEWHHLSKFLLKENVTFEESYLSPISQLIDNIKIIDKPELVSAFKQFHDKKLDPLNVFETIINKCKQLGFNCGETNEKDQLIKFSFDMLVKIAENNPELRGMIVAELEKFL